MYPEHTGVISTLYHFFIWEFLQESLNSHLDLWFFPSWEEFLEMTRRQEFNQDPGWKPIDQEQVYSQAEVEAYERQRQAEVDRLVREGKIPSIPPQYAHYGHVSSPFLNLPN